MTRFTVNVGFLFRELPYLERFAAVRRAGFDAVELAWPAAPLAEVRAAVEAGLRVGQMNMEAGDLDAGERGWASHPHAVMRWRAAFEAAVALTTELDCPVINVLAGNAVPGLALQEQDRCLRDNLRWALPRAERAGRTLLLEVLNAGDTPTYRFTDTASAAALIAELGDPRLRLQFDTYHVATGGEEVVDRLRALAPIIGHVQVADAPGRHEPGSGRIDFAALFGALAEVGYAGAVGLEYVPSGDTIASLAWLPRAERGWSERAWRPTRGLIAR